MTKIRLGYFLIAGLILFFCFAFGQAQQEISAADAKEKSGHILSSEEVATLLARPECFGSPGDTTQPYIIKDYSIPSKGVELSAQLYLPSEVGLWPVAILVPGGFNETELIMESPRYYASRLARCGIAALVYYKRGTGPPAGCTLRPHRTISLTMW
jgi:hypothetical protein